MTTPNRPRPTGPLWLAAGGCALLGAVLLGPALLPDRPGHRTGSPAAGALPAANALSASAPAAAGAEPAPAGPGPQNPDEQSPASPDSSPAGTATPTEPHDDDPVAPVAPPLPAEQVQGHGDVVAPAADPGQWRPVVTGFAEDFTRAGDGTSDWATRLARWTSPQLAATYSGVDDREIPTGRLLEVTTSDVGTFTLAFTARYDTGLVLHGQAAYGPTSWRVTATEPGQPPGPDFAAGQRRS